MNSNWILIAVLPLTLLNSRCTTDHVSAAADQKCVPVRATIAGALARDGAFVYLTDINDEPGQALAGQLAGQAGYMHLDVHEEADWQAVPPSPRYEAAMNSIPDIMTIGESGVCLDQTRGRRSNLSVSPRRGHGFHG